MASHFQFFCMGLKSVPRKNVFFWASFCPVDPWRWNFCSSIEELKTSLKKLIYLYFKVRTSIWVIFSKNTPKMPTYFFQVKIGGIGVFFFNFFFWSFLDRPKTTQNQLDLRNLPPLVTPYPPNTIRIGLNEWGGGV